MSEVRVEFTQGGNVIDAYDNVFALKVDRAVADISAEFRGHSQSPVIRISTDANAAWRAYDYRFGAVRIDVWNNAFGHVGPTLDGDGFIVGETPL